MKNKIFIILILFSLFMPSISQAVIFLPTANLTLLVNTQGQDSVFTFNSSDGEQFILQTENSSASQTVGIIAFGGQYILTQENLDGLTIESIDCISDNQDTIFSYQLNGVRFLPTPDENITCTFNNTKGKIPVLIVPGLLGTEIKSEDNLLWLNLEKMFTDIGDDFMDPLAFNSGLISTHDNLQLGEIIRNIPFFNYTDSLIDEFGNQGYIENENLFTFPYDWRYGVSGKYVNGKTNSDLLGEKIQDIITQTGSDKVDIIAHSLGGLVVKKYVISYPINHHIDRLVFVGVPNTGAPKAIKALLQGDDFDIKFLKIPFLSQDKMKEISENLPAAYDLLPSQQYYDVKGSFLKIVDNGSLMDINDQTEKDLNYGEFGNFITSDHNLNSKALINAENLHTADFNNFDMRTAGIDLYAIDGCRAGTIGTIIENRFKNIFGYSFTEYKTPKFTPGDGTVPLESSTNLPINQNNKFYSLMGEHSKMMSQNGSRQQIVNIISGSNLKVEDKFITQNIADCNLNGKAISVFSPINIFVTDQNGNELGNADDGSILNEIPNAAFEIFGEHKFLYLPTDNGQIYTVNIKGITNQNLANNQVVGTEVFSNLPVTAKLSGQINLGSQTTLTVKETSESGDQTILPSAVLNGVESEDVVLPTSSSILSGTLGQPNFYRSDVGVLFNAEDDISGVLAVNYNIDGQGYQKVLTDSTTVSITKEGSHTVSFFATDNAGNNEQEKTISFTIDKTAPETIIQFDPVIFDIKFTGTDNISDVSKILIKDQDNIITITDQAGNITEITLHDKNRRKLMLAQIKSIKYNGLAANINKNGMMYLWFLGKGKKLTNLFQSVSSKTQYNILAVFNGKNTKITGKDFLGKISKSFDELKIIKISTNKGDFNWSY